MKVANVYYNGACSGELIEYDDHYEFKYSDDYLKNNASRPISLSLPLTKKAYKSDILFPFFDGLIPEGYLLDLIIKKYNIKATNRLGLLLHSGLSTIGAVTIEEK